MSRTKLALTSIEKMQRDADEFFGENPLAGTKELAEWAIRTGRWEPPTDIVLKRCRQDFSRALREQYIEDEFGRPVRAKHAIRVTQGDRQKTLWADIRNLPRERMVVSFQQRREQIVGDCRQLERDIEYYNKLNSDQPAIQMVFDFRDDIEEARFSGTYPKHKPIELEPSNPMALSPPLISKTK